MDNKKETSNSIEGTKILNNTLKRITRSADGTKYQVATQWKDNKCNLKNNYKLALKRLNDIERQLRKEPMVQKIFIENINKYVEK